MKNRAKLFAAYFVVPLAGICAPATVWAADPASGPQAFKVCTACHMVGPNAKNRIGPPLNGVAGKKWGSADGFAYSENLKAGGAGGKVWDDAALNDYLEDPKRLAPQGKMAFGGVKEEAKRADIIAYLKQFDEAGNRR
jgi:cytochrome c